MVGDIAPLMQNPPTTNLLLSFSPPLQQFLQILAKPSVFTSFNHSIYGSLLVYFPSLRSFSFVQLEVIIVLMVASCTASTLGGFSTLTSGLCWNLLHEMGPPQSYYHLRGSLDPFCSLKLEIYTPYSRDQGMFLPLPIAQFSAPKTLHGVGRESSPELSDLAFRFGGSEHQF